MTQFEQVIRSESSDMQSFLHAFFIWPATSPAQPMILQAAVMLGRSPSQTHCPRRQLQPSAQTGSQAGMMGRLVVVLSALQVAPLVPSTHTSPLMRQGQLVATSQGTGLFPFPGLLGLFPFPGLLGLFPFPGLLGLFPFPGLLGLFPFPGLLGLLPDPLGLLPPDPLGLLPPDPLGLLPPDPLGLLPPDPLGLLPPDPLGLLPPDPLGLLPPDPLGLLPDPLGLVPDPLGLFLAVATRQSAAKTRITETLTMI